MAKSIVIFIFSLLQLFLFFGCGNKRQESTELLIVQTTDIHGSIFPFDFVENKVTNHSLANIYTTIQQERQQNKDAFILLDNGDYLQGQPTVYYYNFEDTVSSHLAARVMNFMGYDACTLGNHDIETGHPVYDRYRKQIKAPLLSANILDAVTGKPYFKPYTVIDRKGVKIAVLGLTTPGIAHWLPENLWSGMIVKDMVETAKMWVPIIMEKEKPDILVGLFHSGIDYKTDNSDTSQFMNENASRLVAEKVPGFDLVLAGHDHRKYIEKLINSAGDTVILMDAQSHCKSISEVKVLLHLNRKTNRYQKTWVAKVVDVDNEPADSLFMATFSSQFEAVKKYTSQQIGEFSESMDSKDAYFGNSAFIDFIQQVQLDVTHADISFADPLSFRSQINKGPIFVSDLFKLYKYENALYTMSLSGSEIDRYLEFSASLWFNQMHSSADHLLKLKTDDDGNATLENRYYSFSSAAGIEYIVDVSKPEGNRVAILGLSNGIPFYSDSLYTVAVNSYRGSGGGGHLTKGVGLSFEQLRQRHITTSTYDMRHYVRQWIENHQTIVPKKGTNWRIIPEDYFEFGKRRDMELLFGMQSE